MADVTDWRLLVQGSPFSSRLMILTVVFCFLQLAADPRELVILIDLGWFSSQAGLLWLLAVLAVGGHACCCNFRVQLGMR